jgi:uncharacterized protein YkwD
MRCWILFALSAGCGQMYQAPGGQPPPASPTPPAPSAATPPGGDPGAGHTPEQGRARRLDDPYPDPAAASPASRPGHPPSSSRPAPPPEPRPAPVAEPAASPRPQPGVSAEAQALVDAHNQVRAKHCAGPLTWSPKLAQVAQKWANSLRDKGCAFGHSNGSYGENLAAGSTGLLDPEAVVKMWYDEIAQYKFPNGGFSMQTGHFTQVVWRGTTQVGCGRSQCKGLDIWVCEYDPPGNWEGQYRENVRPLGCR